jgi:DNA-binding transcriptional MocR family regulator
MGRLVERFNLDSGQCNPSLETLARETGYTERSVRRALEELEELGLVRRIVNAGRGHSNQYDVDLDAVGAIAARAAPQPKPDSGEKRTPLSAKPDGRVLQNRVRKQIFQRPRARPDPQQREMLMPMPSAEASQAGAERRVMDDIEQAVRRQPSFNVSGLTPTQWADVHAAERHRRGEGIVLIRRILDDRRETGPPRVAAEG